jgi:hypothetical protein
MEVWLMASLLDHQRELPEGCGLSTDGSNSCEIADVVQVLLNAADSYRLRAEAPILDEHVRDEFQLKYAEATMHTMVAEPYLTPRAYAHRRLRVQGDAALLQVPLHPRLAA